MQTNSLKGLLIGLFFLAIFIEVRAASITGPILMEFNFPNASICKKTSMRVKFDHAGGFLFNNIFTVEMAVNGDFTGTFYTLNGSLAQAGSAPNAIVVVTFPDNVPAGDNYRIRMKGSSPLTYSSDLNQFPFSITAPPAFDTLTYPTGYWKGNFYRWTPTTPEVIADGNTQDIFNPANYLGYITEDTMSFDFNWGNGGPVPSNLPDTNKVCGSQSDFFSIRMMRKINFEAGFYVFGGGADDGFRLSIDGGATWLIDLWYDHQMLGKMHNEGCGVFIPEGPRNVVAEYYENKTDSRFRVIIKRTGDPGVNPISITYPTDGTAICVQSSPFQMTANPPGAYQWSGPGVSPTGMFNPQVAGVGFRSITYETGYAGFGSNCLKTTSVTVNVVSGFTANFSGLDTAYCPSTSLVNLVPQTAGGIFFGPGVNGSNFDPSQLAPGFYTIGYTLNAGSGCGDDTIRKTVHIRPLPDAGFADLPDSVCKGSGNLILVPNTPGGTFAGQGVISQNQQWVPSILLSSNSYQIEYQITANGCTSSSEQFVYILDKIKPAITIQELKTRYCTTDSAFVPVSSPSGSWYLNGNAVTQVDPTSLTPGNYMLTAVFNPTTNPECIDSASAKVQFAVIASPTPDLGPDVEVELGMNLTLDPKITSPYSWSTAASGYSFDVDKPLTFEPLADMTVTVTAPDPTGTCIGTDDILILVRPRLEIPNLFTPNGDGANQDWRFKGAYPNMKITIFDRWGKQVYKGENQGELAWDGSGSDKTGLFFYVVEHPTDGRKWNGWLKLAE